MRPRTLGSFLASYFLALLVAASVLRAHVSLSPPARATTVRTFWQDGTRVERQILEGEPGATWPKRADRAAHTRDGARQ